MRYVMLVDSHKCMDCKACVLACQQHNNVPYGFSRNWIRQSQHKEVPAGIHFQPGACMHCENPPCVEACPTLATWWDANGVVLIDHARCIGCGNCISACPYNARFKHPVGGYVDKCDYCLGSCTPPACVAVCPSHCRVFGDADDANSDVARILSSKNVVHITPDGVNIHPTLGYIEGTVPNVLPAPPADASPVDSLKNLSKGLTWVGGFAILAIGGTWLRQLIWPSQREEGIKQKTDELKKDPTNEKEERK